MSESICAPLAARARRGLRVAFGSVLLLASALALLVAIAALSCALDGLLTPRHDLQVILAPRPREDLPAGLLAAALALALGAAGRALLRPPSSSR